jgi:hypothetical protein
MITRNPPAWLPEAQAMKAAGIAQRKIAVAVHAGHESVRLWLAKYPRGTTPPPAPLPESGPPAKLSAMTTYIPPDRLQPAKQMRLDGMSWRLIAEALDVTIWAVRAEIDPGFVEYQAQKNRSYLAAGGLAKRTSRLRKERQEERLAIKDDREPRARVSGDILATGRFYCPADRRAGR